MKETRNWKLSAQGAAVKKKWGLEIGPWKEKQTAEVGRCTPSCFTPQNTWRGVRNALDTDKAL